MSLEPDVVAGRPVRPPVPGRDGGPARTRRAAALAGLALGALSAQAALAADRVSALLVEEAPATPLRYSVDGRTYTWGLGANQTMLGFVAEGRAYGYTDTVTRVELRRDDVAGVAEGNPCGVFVERLDDTGESLAADYPSDGSGTGECDMPELLASRVVNRGALDLFSNVAPDAKNVERADFVFDHGTLAPFVDGGRELAGHVVGEKRGNNPVRVAAILALDVFGQPAEYGPLVEIDAKHDCRAGRPCYTETDLVHAYSFFQNERLVPQGYPSETGQSIETVAVAFVDLVQLGLHPGQRYFGFSLFADDVDRHVHTLTDPSTFPDDTSDEEISAGDDADIYGGLAGYFVADELNVATGRVYLDENDDGAFGEGDAGIADIGLTLYADTDGDGAFDPLTDEPLSDSIDSDPRGLFQFPGLADGGHFVVLHEGDPDIPGGLEIVSGVNPQAVFVSGADVDGVDFPFSNGDAPVGGDDGGADGAGTGDAGQADGGSDDAGQGDAGQGDAGEADAGQEGDGQADAGVDDAGQTDAGEADGGQGDAGQGDAGQADAGQTDAGQVDGGQGDAGEADGGQTDGGQGGTGQSEGGQGEAGQADGGQGDAGQGDAGQGDAGQADAGQADAGQGDAGQGDAGEADAGQGDAGQGDGGQGGTGQTDGGQGDAGQGGTGQADAGQGDAGQGDAGQAGGGQADGGQTDAGQTDAGQAGAGETDGGQDGGDVGDPDADDSSTNAVADTAATDQGRPVTIDVLANDTDAAGAGLTILSVSDSPDADIVIEADAAGAEVVTYTPDFGFFGTDTFMYTIADGDGTEATGTVTVSVLRFSDIDGNGINDFVECDCTDLTLETGVHGSGIGRVSLVSLAGLSAMLLVAGARRRRRAGGPPAGAPPARAPEVRA